MSSLRTSRIGLVLIVLIGAVFPCLSDAQINHSLVFRREKLTIRQPESFVIFTKEEDGKPISPENRGNPVPFSVQVRSEDAFLQDSIAGLGAIKANTGILMVLDYPLDVPLLYMPVRRPLDVLFINEHGMVVQLIPNIVLETLREEIHPVKPVKALLYLAGGICEEKGIRPGHVVEHPTFRPKPTVIN